MTDQQWQQAWEIYRAARELPEDQRRSYISSISADPEVFEQVILLVDEPVDRSPAASDLKPGTRISHYEVSGKLGRGGMGQVYAARDPELGRDLALKLLAPEFIAMRPAMERLVREARAASALNHPHIITVYEVVRSGDDVAIAMELVEGEALRSYCGQPQPVAKVIHWGRQIAQALAAAHARNIVHRDIKPENVMVRPDGYIKVLDFGLAGQSAPGDQSGCNQRQWSNFSIGGTLSYMAPEQTRAEPSTSASDVFSMGVVLYELATGAHPFLSDSPIDTARAIAHTDPKAPAALNREIPPALNSLVLEMLAKDARARPSALEVDRRLSKIEAAGGERWPRGLGWFAGGVAACAIALTLSLMRERIFPPKEPVLIQLTMQGSGNRITAAALSPDGTQLAFAALGGGIHVRRMKGGLDETLSTPAGLQVERLAWFADETKLVASGFSLQTNVSTIWIISRDGVPPRILREHAREASPSPDGTAVAFVSQNWSEIWLVGVNGEKPHRIAGGPATDTFPLVFWSPDGKRVSFQHGSTEYASTVAATARKVAVVPDVRMSSASALPDGRILFLQSNPSDSGVPDQLWEVKTDLETGGFREPARKIAAFPHQNQTRIYGMSSAADGKHIIVIRGSDRGAIFIADFNESPPHITHTRRLTPGAGTNDYPHAWTADSRAVIFESNRNGGYDLFRQNVDAPTPETIAATPLTKMLAQLGPDGHWVLYAARDDDATVREFKLMRVPAQGGTSEEIPIGGSLDEFRCALDAGKRCVLRTTVQGEYYKYYDLDPIQGKGRELARTKWTPGFLGDWDISPDGTEVAIPDHDSPEGRIRVIALVPRPNQPREREVVLPGPIDLHGLVWAANGRGWFVSVRTTLEYRMLYVYLDGHFCPLGDIQGWAVPSPNGQRVAFWNHTVATNAWLIERH